MSEINFRAVGFSNQAINFPLSLSGQQIIAMHNGVHADQLPEAARYSSNAYMHKWIERLGEEMAAGHVVNHDNGAWLTLNELEARDMTI